jgi:NADPH-dependent 2,4-dienoyl-CoA reductase/sulfur reductase-like enzyme
VLVVGGGPGGLMAAITAAQRGHKVILCEKEQELGGALRSERKVPFKRDLYALPAKYGYLARKLGVEIRLGTEVTPALAEAEQPDALICAVGAEPIIPPLPGIDGNNVVLGVNLSDDNVEVGQSVAVLGGGLVGCEMGLHLAMEGKQVTVIEMLPRLATDANPRHRPILLDQMEQYGITGLVKTRGVRVTEEGLVCADVENHEILIKADTVVCAVGMRPRRDVAESLRNCAPVFQEVGDCTCPSIVVEATSRGYYAALDI